MSTEVKTLNEVNHLAIRLLSEQMGVVDALRFVNQFTSGQGNYTDERDSRFGQLSLSEIVSAIEKQRPGRAADAS